MESDNKEKSIVSEYLEQNKNEAQKTVDLASASKDPSFLVKRILAGLLDRAILTALSAIAINPVFTLVLGIRSHYFVVHMVVEFLYAGYFYSSQLASPGKLVFNLQVIKGSGGKLSFVEGGLRDSIGKTISGLILGIGYLMVLFRSDRMALHDLMFKTKVVLKT